MIVFTTIPHLVGGHGIIPALPLPADRGYIKKHIEKQKTHELYSHEFFIEIRTCYFFFITKAVRLVM